LEKNSGSHVHPVHFNGSEPSLQTNPSFLLRRNAIQARVAAQEQSLAGNSRWLYRSAAQESF